MTWQNIDQQNVWDLKQNCWEKRYCGIMLVDMNKFAWTMQLKFIKH